MGQHPAQQLPLTAGAVLWNGSSREQALEHHTAHTNGSSAPPQQSLEYGIGQCRELSAVLGALGGWFPAELATHTRYNRTQDWSMCTGYSPSGPVPLLRGLPQTQGCCLHPTFHQTALLPLLSYFLRADVVKVSVENVVFIHLKCFLIFTCSLSSGYKHSVCVRTW